MGLAPLIPRIRYLYLQVANIEKLRNADDTERPPIPYLSGNDIIYLFMENNIRYKSINLPMNTNPTQVML